MTKQLNSDEYLIVEKLLNLINNELSEKSNVAVIDEVELFFEFLINVSKKVSDKYSEIGDNIKDDDNIKKN